MWAARRRRCSLVVGGKRELKRVDTPVIDDNLQPGFSVRFQEIRLFGTASQGSPRYFGRVTRAEEQLAIFLQAALAIRVDQHQGSGVVKGQVCDHASLAVGQGVSSLSQAWQRPRRDSGLTHSCGRRLNGLYRQPSIKVSRRE